eukprot:TRINITY_DN8692_c0_g14_i1.p1 TRINITY_DN8692_c0_g14~~TRINITY_DN8692_c0_g14_i1.p1  ORF type:complete len:330 (+),score=119.85 TRINITY_DN8692_c0_g14_i1:92-1081(+)
MAAMKAGHRTMSMIHVQEAQGRDFLHQGLRQVNTAVAFQQELIAARASGKLLLVELFAHWCGPCEAVIPTLARAMADTDPEVVYESGLTMFSSDLDLLVADLKKNEAALDWSQVGDDTAPSRWSRVVLFWIGVVEPVFLFFRRGRVIAVVEGPNVPQIEFDLEWGSRMELDVSTVRVAQCQREIDKAVFTLQMRWRKRKFLRKQGVYVDGKWMSHEEVRKQEDQRRREMVEKEARVKRQRAAVTIQRFLRGHLARKFVRANKRALLQRYRQARRNRGDEDAAPRQQRRASNARRTSTARRGTRQSVAGEGGERRPSLSARRPSSAASAV